MLTKVFIMMFGLSALIIVGAEDPLCTKYGEPHTLCFEAKSCPADANGGPCGVTDADKEEILRVHNEERQRVANGEETRGSPGPQPAGTNLRELTWNDDLARGAQRWAEQPVNDHDCDECSLIPGYTYVGQNYYSEGSSGKLTSVTNWEKAINSWIAEVNNMTSDLTKVPGTVTGHYAQVVWHDTKEVGCGVFSDNEKCTWIAKWDDYYCAKYICNYGPTGNWRNKLPYSTTEGCITESTNYPGLCTA